MKKILGISLCALFAVSAANAEIASTEWVSQQVGGMDAAATTGEYVKVVSQADGKVSATGASFEKTFNANTDNNAPTSKAVATYVQQQVSGLQVGNLAERVDTNETNITNLTSRVGTNEASIGTLNSSMTTLSGKVDINTTNIATHENKIGEHTEAIQGMDLTATTGEYVKVVSQADGKVSAEGASFEDTLNAATQDNAPTSKAVADHVKGAINALDVDATTGNYVKVVSQADGKVVATDADFEATLSATTTDNAPTSKAVADYVAGKVDGLGVGALEGRVDANEGAIAANTSNIATNATNIQTNKTNIQTNAGNIATNTTNIATLDGRVDGHDTSITNLTGRVAQNETDITALETSVNGLGDLAHKDTVAAGDINPGAIVDADISDAARIATGKIAFSDAEEAALGSTITAAKVGQIETNKTNITSLQTTVSQHNEALKPSSECLNNADGCTLVYRNNAYSWEKITREAQ